MSSRTFSPSKYFRLMLITHIVCQLKGIFAPYSSCLKLLGGLLQTAFKTACNCLFHELDSQNLVRHSVNDIHPLLTPPLFPSTQTIILLLFISPEASFHRKGAAVATEARFMSGHMVRNGKTCMICIKDNAAGESGRTGPERFEI